MRHGSVEAIDHDFRSAGRSLGFPVSPGESSPSPLPMLNLAGESAAG